MGLEAIVAADCAHLEALSGTNPKQGKDAVTPVKIALTTNPSPI